MDATEARAQIQRTFPGIGVLTVRPFGDGWANTTWLVNESLVFRFPKHERVAAATLKEMAVLPILRPALPAAAPDYRYAAPDALPLPFGGYTLVPGTPLGDTDRTINLGTIAAEVGKFLTALHGFPVAIAKARGVPGGTAEQWRAEYGAFRDLIGPMLAPYVADHEYRRIATEFESFLQDDRHFTFTPVVLHRDLVDEHILVDQRTATLSGIIDFEDMSIGDPAFDFTGIVDLGPEALAAYRGPLDEGFAERIGFYSWLRPLHAIRYGVEAALPAHIDDGLARLRLSLVHKGP
jgi:aminoglycoside 2''-phosphotransferase